MSVVRQKRDMEKKKRRMRSLGRDLDIVDKVRLQRLRDEMITSSSRTKPMKKKKSEEQREQRKDDIIERQKQRGDRQRGTDLGWALEEELAEKDKIEAEEEEQEEDEESGDAEEQ